MKKYSNLDIYNLITKGVKVKDIPSKIGLSKSTVSYHLSSMVKAGIIKKIGYATWKILKKYDEKEVKAFIKTHSKSILKQNLDNKHPILDDKKVRGHAFIYKARTKNVDLKSIKYILGKKGIHYEIIRKKCISLTIKAYKIHIWPKKIIIYSPKNYFSDKAYKCKKQAISDMLNILKYLEDKLNTSFKIGADYVFSVVRSHYAIMNDEGAKHFRDSGEKIEVKDEYGTWHIMDKSFNIDEAEFWKNKNPDRSQDIKDADGYKLLINDYKKNKWKTTPSFFMEVIHNQLKVNDGFQKTHHLLDKNIKSHIGAIKDLSKGVKKFNSSIEKLFKKLDK